MAPDVVLDAAPPDVVALDVPELDVPLAPVDGVVVPVVLPELPPP